MCSDIMLRMVTDMSGKASCIVIIMAKKYIVSFTHKIIGYAVIYFLVVNNVLLSILLVLYLHLLLHIIH